MDVRAGAGTCEGFGRWTVGEHLGIVLAELGELPDPKPPAPVAPAVRCPDCMGDGHRKMYVGDRPTDWRSAPCRRSGNTGPVAVPAADQGDGKSRQAA